MVSNPSELQEILKRLSELETQNRRLKCLGFFLLVGLSTLVLMGQGAPTPRVIEAQRFVLKDAKGNVRAWFGLLGKGSELTLGNVNKEPKMALRVSDDASDLHFFGSENSGMTLGVDSGSPAISMAGAAGNGGVEVNFSTEGPSMALKDGNGFSTVVGAFQRESTVGKEVKLPTAASVTIFDKSGKVIWKAP